MRGLRDLLIGSYARRVSIWPGKDVDVLGRLMRESRELASPDFVYSLFEQALEPFDSVGRLTKQPRSLNVRYTPARPPERRFIESAASQYRWDKERLGRVLESAATLAFDFAVDVVPAVPWGEHYGIPEVDIELEGERRRTGDWRRTSPHKLTTRTRELNGLLEIEGAGAFVRLVKEIRQVKASHLAGSKPGSLFYEFMLHEGFVDGSITGASWAELTESALQYIRNRLGRALNGEEVLDPILKTPFAPAPPDTALQSAWEMFDELARRAHRALITDQRCQAAIEWRHVFGENKKFKHVFPLPPGCRGTGVEQVAALANTASGGTAERSFGGQ